MKRFLLIALLPMALLTGCSTNENPRMPTDNSSITIYVDRETGVNYYVYNGGYSGGITTRVNGDGSPFVSEVK